MPNEVRAKQNNEKLLGNGLRVRWLLVFYDTIIFFVSGFTLLYFLHPSMERLDPKDFAIQMLIAYVCVFSFRIIFLVYSQIWRYGGMKGFAYMLLADGIGGVCYYAIEQLFAQHVPFASAFSFIALSYLLCYVMRVMYFYMYSIAKVPSPFGKSIKRIISIFGNIDVKEIEMDLPSVRQSSIKVAIVGAGRVGASLCRDLLDDRITNYAPVMLIDSDKNKGGMEVYGVPVFVDDEKIFDIIEAKGVQEIVFAIPNATPEARKRLYERFSATGCKIKVYDYPVMNKTEGGRKTVREFDVDELLFRNQIEINTEETYAYYKDKTVLITGGGGSIGSEISRQLAMMEPKALILLDIYENGVYDVQQELILKYGKNFPVHVEICSVTDRQALKKVFDTYMPDVVVHAAAHKHVPLMEHNVCEAVKNNIFGTFNTMDEAFEHETGHFIMVSTDKAVNPTNVMGATKRFCEYLMESFASKNGKTIYSATRFGNVLGSAGSVIPLFKRQIANGGPVTLTDKRIIRYFMTIPEASQLVLESGAMAKQGELFVLDMGQPVKILELAESMIRLAGFEPYRDIDIIETGLRPGEKLYEELLIKSETLTKTKNKLIFIEKDEPITSLEVEKKLRILGEAINSLDDDFVRKTMHDLVKTYKDPNKVNAEAIKEAKGKEIVIPE